MKARDKRVQKMTRDGAVGENRATGEAERISHRDTEPDLMKPQDAAQPLTPEAGQRLKPPLPMLRGGGTQDTGTAERVFDRLDSEKSRHKNKKAVKKANELIRQQGKEPQPEPDAPGQRSRQSSRLQFTEDERADPALSKAIRKSDAAADKLDTARAKIPKQKRPVVERTFDEAKGKSKVRLAFQETDKPVNGKMKHKPAFLDRLARGFYPPAQAGPADPGIFPGYRVRLFRRPIWSARSFRARPVSCLPYAFTSYFKFWH